MSPADHAVVVSPAGPIAIDVLNPGLETLRSLHVPVFWPDERWREDVLRRQGYLAGSDDQRATQLKRALDLSPRGVWMARGGYGCIRTLDRAVRLFGGEPVPLWGFSDGTALLSAWCRANWPAWHAPPLSQLPRLDPDSARRVGLAWHQGDVPPFEALKTLQSGTAAGPLAGGNLTVLASLIGTPHEADLRDRIVVLEDVGEVAYRVDRLVTQLRLGGGLDEAAGIVLGDFTDISEAQREAVQSCFQELSDQLSIPIAWDLPVGHGSRNAPLPFGVGWEASLTARESGATLTITRDVA